MSARIGGDPMLTQGPGGNTSLKADDHIWVKASGHWLAQATTRSMFVPLRLAQVREQIEAGEAEDFSAAIAGDVSEGQRPSIETAFHALMPHPVVVHAHAVNSMTVGVLRDGEAIARARLDGVVEWRWVPYRRPGRRLAEAIRERTLDETANVLILQNHGIVVGAGTPEEAERLLRDVEDRFNLPAAPLPVADTNRLAPFESKDYCACRDLSGVALADPILDRLTVDALVPDQVVFLGGQLPSLASGESADDAASRVLRSRGIAPAFLAVRGAGVLGWRARSDAAAPLMQALIEIARRIPANAAINGLSAQDLAELLGWDAEHYRQSLDRSGPSCE
jgi:rhamnose utilization protein RhaD (predicted bifunctional aldolase and dehydrogenase)